MTDNEKAATFIGWEPGQRCGLDGATICNNCDERMLIHASDEGCYDHPLAAPDMSDPRNYIKALEAVRVKGDYYPEIFTNTIGWLARFGKVVGPPLDDGEPFTLCRIAESHADLGVAVVKALAALYNAEHSNDV